MIETLTVQIDSQVNEILHQRCNTLKVPVDKVVEQLIRDFLDVAVAQPTPSTLCDDPKLDHFLKNLVKNVEVAGSEPFFGDLTYNEYFALSDSKREALWNQQYRQELDKAESKTREREALPDAIPAGQGRSATTRRSSGKQRTR